MSAARIMLLATVVLLSGCGIRLMSYKGYSGDGMFVPHPAPAWICQDGYTVDFGTIDLTVAGDATFRIEGLPSLESTVGLAVGPKTKPTGAYEDPPRLSPLIEVTLRDAEDHIVLSRHERLSQWTRRFALGDPAHVYFYQRGAQVEVPLGPNTVRVERFPIGQDDSWGTYFTPRRGARYTLHFTVEEADPAAANLEAHLQIQAGAGCPGMT
jgi:hypothetical protein